MDRMIMEREAYVLYFHRRFMKYISFAQHFSANMEASLRINETFNWQNTKAIALSTY